MTEPTQAVALITGGGQRIGAQLCQTLHQAGFRIAIHYRHSKAAAEALATQLNTQRPDSAAIFQANLNDSAAHTTLADSVLAHFGQVDVLVNNASSFYATPVGEATENQWDDLFNSNVKAAFFLSQALVPALSLQQGCIVNIVDIHSEKPMKHYAIYSMAKAALNMMTKALAKDLGGKVRVNGVSPGAILWPEAEVDDTEKQQAILQKIAIGKMGQPQDIADAVLFVVQQGYLTGQIINIDGGRSLNM
jgi:pteridine reductase